MNESENLFELFSNLKYISQYFTIGSINPQDSSISLNAVSQQTLTEPEHRLVLSDIEPT